MRTAKAVRGLLLVLLLPLLLLWIVMSSSCAGPEHLGKYTRQSADRIFQRQAMPRGPSTVLPANADDAEWAAHNLRSMSMHAPQGAAPTGPMLLLPPR